MTGQGVRNGTLGCLGKGQSEEEEDITTMLGKDKRPDLRGAEKRAYQSRKSQGRVGSLNPVLGLGQQRWNIDLNK